MLKSAEQCKAELPNVIGHKSPPGNSVILAEIYMPFPENSGADRLGVTYGVATNPVFRPAEHPVLGWVPSILLLANHLSCDFVSISVKWNVIAENSAFKRLILHTIEGLLKGGLINAREMHPCSGYAFVLY